jgi:Family of unknown function (DUF6445)
MVSWLERQPVNLAVHPAASIQTLTFGREQQPLLVIDNLVADAESLVELAATKLFGDVATFYPGVRAKVPLTYQHFILERFGPLFREYFGLAAGKSRFTACHFSLVTMPPEKLDYLQRVPHCDSYLGSQLAFVHYLFKADLGGTAFYRQRSTGFEFIDEARTLEYLRYLEEEKYGPHAPPPGYINGDTPLYEEVGRQQGLFNRMLVYRRTSLHSGCIAPGFRLDSNPRSGRLSVNGFLV